MYIINRMNMTGNIRKRLFMLILMAIIAFVFFHLGQQKSFDGLRTSDLQERTNKDNDKDNPDKKEERKDKNTQYINEEGNNKDTPELNVVSLDAICPDTRRPTEVQYTFYGKWQITKRGHDNIVVYSAFYDDRPAVGKLPVIQVLTVSTTKEGIYCHVWYEGKMSPHVTQAEIRSSGGPYAFTGETYNQYLLTCKLPITLPIPTHVTLAGSRCGKSTILLPITRSPRKPWQAEFGICVGILYGEINKFRFIEWMEMSMLFGVEEVHIYNGTVTDSIKNVFDVYVKEHKLFVHDMPPAVKSWTRRGAELGSPASMNDCMLRYMYRYRYILYVDLDEIIVPQKAENYHDLVDQVKKEHNLKEDLPVYSFPKAYFLLDFPADEKEPVHMVYLRYQNRAKPGSVGFPKSMVDPRRCMSVFNHYCLIPFPGVQHGSHYGVKSSLGVTHHYKSCNMNPTQCTLLKNQKTKDSIMLKFKSELSQRIERRIKVLEKDLLHMVKEN